MLSKCGACESEGASERLLKVSDSSHWKQNVHQRISNTICTDGNSKVVGDQISSGEYLPLLLLSVNSEDLKGWIQCLSSREFLVHTFVATKQGEIQVTVV